MSAEQLIRYLIALVLAVGAAWAIAQGQQSAYGVLPLVGLLVVVEPKRKETTRKVAPRQRKKEKKR